MGIYFNRTILRVSLTTLRYHSLVWSSDGQSLAVTNFSEIYQVDLGGTATRIHAAGTGHNLTDMTWSRPNGQWLIYRVERANDSWFELLDVGAGQLDGPVAITKLTAPPDAAYRLRMDIGPVYGGNDEVYVLEWTDSGDGARIAVVDISNVVR